MKNIKIGKKLNISFMLILALILIGNTYMIWNLKKTGNLSHELYEGPYKLTTESMGIKRDLVSIGKNLNSAFLSGNHNEFKTIILKEFESINNRLDIFGEIVPENKLIIDETKQAVSDLQKEYENIYAITQSTDTSGSALEIDDKSYFEAFDRSEVGADKLNKMAEEIGLDFDQSVTQVGNKTIAISGIILLINTVLCIFVSIYITRSIKKPIEQLEIAASKMAEGDFDINIDYVSKDELGILSDSIRKMSSRINGVINDTVGVLEEVSSGNFDVETQVEYIGVFRNIEKSISKITNDLSETMEQINRSSDEVKSASDQVASGAHMLSQGAAEQANAIEELSSTISEISEKIKDTATNAKEANVLSLSAGKEVKIGNDKMKDMVNAMEEISNTSNEIGRIIKTIDDIAFQTNILALNAAVEAARAGSAGKGFAVVADEVRNLAAKSAEAAKNTANLIENSIRAVENGNHIVENTANSLKQIMDKTSKTILLVHKITKASEEQSVAVEQVTLGVDQISQVIQTNSATSQESAAASEELSAQASSLRVLIENFSLKEDDTNKKEINFLEEVAITN